MKKWKASLVFTGGVQATLTAAGSGTLHQDYAGDTSSDNVQALPGRAEPLKVDLGGGLVPCASGSTFVGHVAIYAEVQTWKAIGLGDTVGASVQVSCLTGGEQHKLTWGARKASGGGWAPSETQFNCVQLTRDAADPAVFRLSVPDGCRAQDAVVDSRLRFLREAEVAIPFEATITVPGLPGPS